jgi:hypothetical protein
MSDRDESWLDPGAATDTALSELLAAGRDEQPSAAQLQALAERLGPTFNGPGPGSGGGGEPSAGGSSVAAATAISPTAAVSPAALAIAAAAILALCGVWAFHRGRADDAGMRAPALTQPQPAAPITPPVASDRAAPASPQTTAASADAGVAVDPTPPTKRAKTIAPVPATAADTLAELALLEQAHRALPGAPAQALAAVETHERRFPASQYGQERELIAIEALLATKQIERARLRGERFLALYPRSSHGRKVRALIARAHAPGRDADVTPAPEQPPTDARPAPAAAPTTNPGVAPAPAQRPTDAGTAKP